MRSLPPAIAALCVACASPDDGARRRQPDPAASPTPTVAPTTATTPTTTPGPTTTTAPPEPADTLLVGATIHTLDSASSVAEALAVRDGEIVYVGGLAGSRPYEGPDTERIDLEGRFVLPGLHDSHIHLLEAFHPAASTCVVPTYVPLFRLVDDIAACAPQQVGTDWVLGWGFSIFDALFEPDPRGILDRAVPERPVAIMEVSSHAVWVNSAALEALGIDATTPDPDGGLILRDGDGRPNGLLIDSAGEQAFDAALAATPELIDLNIEALREGQAAANAVGITSVGDARAYVDRGYVEAWRALDSTDELTVRAQVALWASPTADDDAQLKTLKALYDPGPGKLRFGQVKLYDDGLLQMTTAALLEPYVSGTLGPDTGISYFPADRLERYVRELQATGFDMHIHAIGDRGVREALDAIEAAGPATTPARHRLTHVEWVHPDDVPRFSALDVTADLQMSAWWVEEQHLGDNAYWVGDERARSRAWPLRDLHDSGARVVLSSDYDVGDLSPFAGMARAIDRGEQSLPDVEAALRAYTTEAAWLLRQEDLAGSLEVGKRADLVVVDRDPYTTGDLAGTVVEWTLLDGEEVYRSPTFTPGGP